MKSKIILLFYLFSSTLLISAQNNKLNLDRTSKSRLSTISKQWGTNYGDASVCLWKGDKTAAFAIFIDDNQESQVDFWKGLQAKYNVCFTWVLITEAGTWPDVDVANAGNSNVKNWSLYVDLANLGNCIGGHDDRNWYAKPTTVSNKDSLTYVTRLKNTRIKIDTELATTKNKCLTYAYPYGEGNAAWARTQYIAFRGTTGTLNNPDTLNYLNVNSISSPYFTTYSVASGVDPLIDPAVKLYNNSYYRGLGCVHFHFADDIQKTSAENLASYLNQKRGEIWSDGFTPIMQYAQSRDTHTLHVTSIAPTQIKFLLTDQMDDNYFYYPLTVKIKVEDNWMSVVATQDSKQLNTQFVYNQGKKYLLVDAVPDRGEVTINAQLDPDPAVFTTVTNPTISTNSTFEYSFEAQTTANDNISFTFDNLPPFATATVGSGNKGTIAFTPAFYNKGKYTFTVYANNGRTLVSKSVALTVVPDSTFIVIKSSNKDCGVFYPQSTALDPDTRTNVIAGGGYATNYQQSAVFPFQLPTIPKGKTIKRVFFNAYLEGFNQPANITGFLNLYLLPVRTLPNVLLTDGYAGDFNSATSCVPIQSNFASKLSSIGIIPTSVTGDSALTSNVKNLYTNVANVGKYVFLRLSNSNTTQPSGARTMFTTTDGANSLVDDNRYPTLFIELKNEALSGVSNVSYDKLKCYPSPLSGNDLYIQFPKEGSDSNWDIQIFDYSGKLCFRKEISDVSDMVKLNLQNLNPQTYIIHCNSTHSNYTNKIVKMN